MEQGKISVRTDEWGRGKYSTNSLKRNVCKLRTVLPRRAIGGRWYILIYIYTIIIIKE
jgi:hypothetical protein